MNRRNFVVGLGTVATISGVASVTAAQFADQVSPTADFRVRPEDEQLTVDATPNFDPNQAYWTDTNLTDFNETEGTGLNSNITAHLDNDSTDTDAGTDDGGTNGDLVATLTFNNTNLSAGNETYDEFAHPNGGLEDSETANAGDGFFEVINNGEVDKSIGLNFGYGSGVDGTNITQSMVADSFKFVMDTADDGSGLTRVSPSSGSEGADPANYVEVSSGQSEIVGLEIIVTDELYEGIQAEAGGAFSETSTALQLIDDVVVGTQ